jgi:hypothetical protein
MGNQGTLGNWNSGTLDHCRRAAREPAFSTRHSRHPLKSGPFHEPKTSSLNFRLTAATTSRVDSGTLRLNIARIVLRFCENKPHFALAKN